MSEVSVNNKQNDKITFVDVESGEESELFVLEETQLGGNKYLLTADRDSDESDAYIFKEVSESESEITYVPVEDDNEYEAIVRVFAELLEETDIISE